MPRKINRYPGVYQRDGQSTWTADIRWTDIHGSSHQHKRGGFRTQAEAVRYKTQYLGDVRQGRIKGVNTPTVTNFLTHDWLPRREAEVKVTTFSTYQTLTKAYIIPHLGHLRLDQLTPRRLEDFYKTLQESGGTGARSKEQRPLSSKSVNNVAGLLNKALRDAVRWDLLSTNPSTAAIKPSAASKEMRFWTPAQLNTFLNESKDDRLHAVLVLAGQTGMRRGELLGLTWDKIDLDNQKVTIDTTRLIAGSKVVTQPPKSRNSIRTLSIDQETSDLLRQLKRRQRIEQLTLGRGLNESDAFLVSDPLGRPLHPNTFTRYFKLLVKRLGLPSIRLHDVRHTYAVAARRAGITTKVISRRLGHSDITITQRIYDHVMEIDDVEAAETTARFVRGSQTLST
jgi:integrase